MDLLPPVGVVSYNGVTWGHRTLTKSVDIKPVYSACGRTVIYNTYALTLESDVYLGVNTPADATLESLRKLLTQPAGQLVYTNKGLGQIVVNPINGAGVRDVNFGPRPSILSWTCPGSNLYVRTVFKIEWSVTDCPASIQPAVGILEFAWRLSVKIDKSGYSTRTYSGFFRVPATRRSVNDRTITATADQLRERVQIDPLPGFRRDSQTFDFDEAKTKCTFSITDVQLPPNQPPPGVIELSVDHVVDSSGAVGIGSRWNGTFTGTYEIARDSSTDIAFRYFHDLVRNRLNTTAKTKHAGDDNPPLVTNYSMHEGVYGRGTASFSASYFFFAKFGDVIPTSGLWSPVPNSDWRLWRQSLDATAFNMRGAAGLTLLPTDDAIVDICQQSQSSILRPRVNAPRLLRGGVLIPMNPYPSPTNSWHSYLSSITLKALTQTVELRHIPLADIKPKPPADNGIVDLNIKLGGGGGGNPFGIAPPNGGGGGIPAGGRIEKDGDGGLPIGAMANIDAWDAFKGQKLSTIQTRNTPSFRAILSGYAIRAGYPIAPPRLISIGGQTCVPMEDEADGFRQWCLMDMLGVPLIAAQWRITYCLPGVPAGQLPIPNTPSFASWAGT